jgi:hypothetical protein
VETFNENGGKGEPFEDFELRLTNIHKYFNIRIRIGFLTMVLLGEQRGFAKVFCVHF